MCRLIWIFVGHTCPNVHLSSFTRGLHCLLRSVCPTTHTCLKLWTKICETRQNFKGDLTKFCETFLNITLELPKYSLNSFCLCKKLVKPQQCVSYVYFFIKSVVKWSEKSVRFELFMGIAFQMGQILWDFISQCEVWHVWIHRVNWVITDVFDVCVTIWSLLIKYLFSIMTWYNFSPLRIWNSYSQ